MWAQVGPRDRIQTTVDSIEHARSISGITDKPHELPPIGYQARRMVSAREGPALIIEERAGFPFPFRNIINGNIRPEFRAHEIASFPMILSYLCLTLPWTIALVALERAQAYDSLNRRSRAVQKLRRARSNCHNCGYPLTALPPSARNCPECGAPFRRRFNTASTPHR